MRNPGDCIKSALNLHTGRTSVWLQRCRAFAARKRAPEEHKFINILGKTALFLMEA
jgi:hypothetical protein